MDAEIQRSLGRVDELRRQAGESPIRKKLRLEVLALCGEPEDYVNRVEYLAL